MLKWTYSRRYSVILHCAALQGAAGCGGGIRSLRREEFCVCLTNIKYQHAKEIADTLRQAIAEKTIECECSSIRVTASFGLSFVDDAGEATLPQLLKEADQAMYKAKDAGRNSVVAYCAM